LEYYFPDLIEAVAKCEETFPNEEGAYTFGSDLLAFQIAKSLLPYMKEITPQSPADLRDEMEFLYAKTVKFSPYKSMYCMAQGQFYLNIGQYDKAVTSFQRAYEIEKNPTIRKWPHLQRSESNQTIFAYLSYAISLSTSANPRPPEPR